MNVSYKFSTLLGTVYKKGNLLFNHDGSVVISPVGNRITLFDLKNNKTQTLPIESRYNLTCLALAPNGFIFIAVNEEGEASLINLKSQTVRHKYRFNKKIRAIQFSPDGKYFAVTKDKAVFLFETYALQTDILNPFIIKTVFKGAYDETVCLDWTSDSRVLAVGSKDMSTRIYSIDNYVNFPNCITLASHKDSIKGCFFKKNSLDIYTVGRNGQVCVWNCNIGLKELILKKKGLKRKANEEETNDENSKAFYTRQSRHYLGDSFRGQSGKVFLSTVDYHKETNLLVTGFSNGAFFLHEMPDFNLIHSLSTGDQFISSICINKTGDWIALGRPALGQLTVWEWQSETYVLQQQGHENSMTCLAYSPEGLHLATGGDDSKVKLWDTDSGLCSVTFDKHTATVTGLVFGKSGKIIVSSSLDGTVRAFDLLRKKNFHTFTTPKLKQFSSVALDSNDEFVCSAAQDSFEVFVWSLKIGQLVETLSRHTGPVSCVSFSPIQTVLASGSWDRSIRFWDVFESKGTCDPITTTSDVLAISYRPDGKQIAVATLDAQITFFDLPSLIQTGSIEGRNDLGSGRRDTDLVKPKTVLKGKAFTTICYTADGLHIIAAGQSKNVCIYNIEQQILIKKFAISQNLSFDGMTDFISRKKMTEFGNLALVEERDDEDAPVSINLPGAMRGDMSSRSFKPEVRVTGVKFSPTGRCWAATTTEGLLIYSLDQSYVFNPFDLEVEITPVTTRQSLAAKDYLTAITHALNLNMKDLITEVVEKVPVLEIESISRALPAKYVQRFLNFLALYLEISPNLEFCLRWIKSLLSVQLGSLSVHDMKTLATINLMEKNLIVKYSPLRTVCEHAIYTCQYTLALGNLKRIKDKVEEGSFKNFDVQVGWEQLQELFQTSLCLLKFIKNPALH